MTRTGRGAWAIVALPWLSLVGLLLHSGSRGDLLGEGRNSSEPRDLALPKLTPRATPQASRIPAPLPSLPPSADEPTASLTPEVVEPATTSPVPVPTSIPRAVAVTELSGGQITEFLERSYRSALPRALGPLSGKLENDVLSIETSFDLAILGEEMEFELPPMLRRLVRGNATVAATGRIVSSEAGIVQFQILSVQVGPVPLPHGTLSTFIQTELERRGKIVVDPMIRPLRLPSGYSQLGTAGDRLRLTHEGD